MHKKVDTPLQRQVAQKLLMSGPRGAEEVPRRTCGAEEEELEGGA